ncbi:uncharacterized protein LOC142413786 isoform X3 [Mycteria americana]|uniref:uncharacterized protein LOC142413786 isoform X3 n=1 Tax=Mycteria americana TaxID=33587 RepID=UPI003F580716
MRKGKGSAQLIVTSVKKAHTRTYTCRMENTRNISENRHSKPNNQGTVSQPEESVIAMECRFEIWSENLMVHVKWYKPAGLEERNQTNTMALGENCTNLTSPGVRAANMGICGCRLFITGTNLTDTGNSMQGTVPRKLTSRQVVEGNQLSMAAPVIGTEDLTYANLTFEKNGTKPASSDIIYTKIKPSQQKQSSGDASAANAGVDVSPEGEGK